VDRVPVAPAPALDGHDLDVEALRDGVGDLIVPLGDDVAEPPAQHPSDGPHRLKATADCPVAPAVEEATCPAFDLIGPEVAAGAHGPSGLELRRSKLSQFGASLHRGVLSGGDPEVLRSPEPAVSRFDKRPCALKSSPETQVSEQAWERIT
jgi:hypothetical protein